MNGFDLAERISERWPAIRILFMSGCANDLSVRRQLYERPLLPKPFTRDELANKVRELLTPAPSNG
jgi:two-component SAPR family response regulator